MKVVFKLGGTLLEDEAGRHEIARQLAEVSRENELVVVHGGGKQVTQYLQERGVESRFVNGLRVSDAAVIEAVTRVIAGGVNKQLVSAIVAAGEAAVGLSGVDGSLTTATALGPQLQFVGRPERTDGRLLDLLVNAGYLPVVACIAGDEQGNIYNVNADQMAVSCAVGWRAEKLYFLTDVPGVKGADGAVAKTLARPAVLELIRSGVAFGGMQAKLEAALSGLHSGLSEVTIAPGHEPNVCSRLLAQEAIGTRLGAYAPAGN